MAVIVPKLLKIRAWIHITPAFPQPPPPPPQPLPRPLSAAQPQPPPPEANPLYCHVYKLIAEAGFDSIESKLAPEYTILYADHLVEAANAPPVPPV